MDFNWSSRPLYNFSSLGETLGQHLGDLSIPKTPPCLNGRADT